MVGVDDLKRVSIRNEIFIRRDLTILNSISHVNTDGSLSYPILPYPILPSLSYQEALVKSGLQNLHNRRDILCRKTFKNIVEDPNHKLHSLLPPVNDEYQYNLRNKRFFRLPKCKTNRFKNTFMIASASQY